MKTHEMLHLGLSVHRANKEFLKKLPAREEYRGLRSLLVRVCQKIERRIVVSPEAVLENREV